MSKDKQRNYERIRVNKDNDLAWIGGILADLYYEHKITLNERIYLDASLSSKGETK